jgi:hypothetical protein
MMRRAIALTLGLLVLLAACSTASRLTTGEVLDALGQSFLDTARTWKAAHDQGLVSDEEYRQFVAWGVSFQAGFQRAYQLWLAGENPSDVRRLVEDLRRDLTLWALRLSQRRGGS